MAEVDRDRDAKLKAWLKQCEPGESLSGGDSRYVDFTSASQGEGLRGNSDPARDLRDLIELSSEESSCQLFSGFSGTGKTTELKRLQQELERRGFIVLYSDAAKYHDLQHPIDIESLLVVIAAAFGDAAGDLHGGASASEGYFERLRAFLTQTDVEISSFGAKSDGMDIKFGLQHQRPMWLEVRDVLRQSLSQLREDVYKFIQKHIDRLMLKFREKQGVVFILDSFEKLKAPGEQFQGILDSVVHVFGSYSEMLRLPNCHTIYTVPLYLQYIDTTIADSYSNRFDILPSIKVVERGGAIYQPGVDAIDELLSQRVELDAFFGDKTAYAMSRMAEASAGHIRTLVRMMRELIVRARRHELPVSQALIDGVIQRTEEAYSTAVRAEYMPVLDGINQFNSPQALRTEELSLLARLLNNQLVLCYRNGEEWLDVHPLVRPLIERARAHDRSDTTSERE